jgi:hypothetical protein
MHAFQSFYNCQRGIAGIELSLNFYAITREAGGAMHGTIQTLRTVGNEPEALLGNKSAADLLFIKSSRNALEYALR